jgi:hypothetical protein
MRMQTGNRLSASPIISFELAATSLRRGRLCDDAVGNAPEVAPRYLYVAVIGELSIAQLALGDALEVRSM